MSSGAHEAGWFPRPLLAGVVCFIGGILLEPFLRSHSGPAIVVAMLAFVLGLMIHNRRGSPAMILIGFVFLGAASQNLGLRRFPNHHISRFTDDSGVLTQIRVKVIDEPRLLTYSNAPRPLPPRQMSRGEVVEVLSKSGWIPSCGTATISIARPIDGLGIGDTVELMGQLSRPAPPDNPGQFDWAKYYRNDRTLASIFVPAAGKATILKKGNPGGLDRLRLFARDRLASGFDEGSALDLALLRALVLGDSDPQLREIQDEFVRTGTSHHLAISGMHIAVVGALAMGLIRLFRFRPRVATAIGLLVTLLYGALVLPNAPVIRSLLLCVTFGASMLLGRKGDGVSLLSASVLLMLAWNPMDLTNPGFQLSCGTVLALMLMTSPTLRWLEGMKNVDQAVADSFVPPRGFRKWRLKAGRLVLASFATAMVAFLASAPIIAFHFNQLNPYAVFASVILAIPVFLALAMGVGKILLSMAIPSSETLAAMAGGPVALMRWMVHVLDQLPGGNRAMPSPSWGVLIAYYALLLLPLWKNKRPWMRWSPVACPILLIAPMLFSTRPDELRMRVLAVGSGQCVVVQLPSNECLLFDAGSLSGSDLSRSIILPSLRQWNIGRIDAAFLSHGNIDHYGLLDELANRVEIQKVYACPHFAADGGAEAEKLLGLLRQKGIAFQTLTRDDAVKFDSADIQVLGPSSDSVFKGNDSSLVLKLSVYGKSILLTGDIMAPAMEDLLSRPDELKTDVLLAPHHGSYERTSPAFIKAAGATATIASSDKTLTGKQLQLDKLCSPLRTGSLGAIDVTISKDGSIKTRGFHSAK